MLRRFVTFLLLLPLVGGCAVLGNEETSRVLVWAQSAGEAQVVPAPKEATYALFQFPGADDIGAKRLEAVRAQVKVAGGKPIGFEKGASGELLAVAGQTKFPLPEGIYWWRDPASPEPLHRRILGGLEYTTVYLGENLTILALVLYPVGFLAYMFAPNTPPK